MTNDSVDQLTRMVADLNTIRECIMQIDPGNNEASIVTLQSLTIKLAQFAHRKLTVVQDLLLNHQQMRYSQLHSPTPAVNIQYNSGFTYHQDDDQRSIISNNHSKVIQRLNSQQNNVAAVLPRQDKSPAYNMLASFNPSVVQQEQRQVTPHQFGKTYNMSRKKLFEETQPPVARHTLMKPMGKVSVMGASKAVCVLQKENDQSHSRMHAATQHSPIPNGSPPRCKEGIVYGNENLIQRPFILLSSPPREHQSRHQNNEFEYKYERKQSQHKQEQSQQSLSQKANSIISGISGFLNKINILHPQTDATDAARKRFFDVVGQRASDTATKQLYDRCLTEQIPETHWGPWIESKLATQETGRFNKLSMQRVDTTPPKTKGIFGHKQSSPLSPITMEPREKSNKELIMQSQEYQYKQKNEAQPQPKRANSVISGISGFLSKISVIPSAPPMAVQTEGQKKKFFDLAVKQKNQLHCMHPAQEIQIPALYDRCRMEQIPEDRWESWIKAVYTQGI